MAKLSLPLLLGAGVVAAFAFGGGKAKATPLPGSVPSPTGKPVDQRMAEVLATNDPAAVRFEAGRLQAEGYPKQAAELEKAARILDQEIAAGARPAPKRGAGFPISGNVTPTTAKSPGLSPVLPRPATSPDMPAVEDLGVLPAVIVNYTPKGAVNTAVQAAASAVPPAMYLRSGSSGPPVVVLQTRLAELGYSPGVADGKFGSKTKQAVEAFQRARGLTVDGVVGPQTAAALFKVPE